MEELVPQTRIESRIFVIRGRKIMLDKDLAELYGVSTKVLNQAVKRNLKRFPPDFMFQLNNQDVSILKSQIVTSSWGGVRKLPFAFTENGVAMLSSVLNSERAIQVNIQIMRTFAQLNHYLSTHRELARKFKELEERVEKKLGKQDGKIESVIDVINNLLLRPHIEIPKPKFKIRGFKKT
ncbi:MAG: ORF6N domain-containing protein [Elusimicrobiota bacterium]